MTDEAPSPADASPIGDRPAEATLYDDPATADLAEKVAEAWTEFGRALATVLPQLPTGSTLNLTLDPTASGVGDAVYSVGLEQAGDELRAYAVSNAMLEPPYRLPRSAVGELVALGWSPPGVVDGADERFGLRLPAKQAERLAAIVSRTMRDIYGTPHPAFLVHSGLQDGDEVPSLGSARPAPPSGDGPDLPLRADLDALPLADKVATVIAAMLKTTPDQLPTDNDGDIGIRSGSAMVFVRVRDNPPLVDVFSPVLTDVDANERLYLKLSELTHRMPIGRLFYTGATVWASVPVFGRDFQASHLMLAVQVMTGLADELDDRLHGEFGGKRFFVEADKNTESKSSGDQSGSDRTGMYL